MASKGNVVALDETKKSLVPSELEGFLTEHAGEGTSQDASDNLIPLIYVLQSNSPQVNSRDPDYIQGAQAGDFWLKGTDIIWKGDEGLPFQSAHWRKNVVEWIPRDAGGGLVAQHEVGLPSEIPGARQVASPKNPDKKIWVNASGDHEFVETRYHAGFARCPDGSILPAVLTLSSTGNTVSRNWMNLMNSFRVKGRPVPSYAREYLLRTAQKTNKSGTWFTIKVSDLGYLPLERVMEGKALYDAFKSGEKRAEAPEGLTENEDDDTV